MDLNDLFIKHSNTYYDAFDQPTEVITKRKYNALIDELFLRHNLDRISLLNDIKNTFDAELQSYNDIRLDNLNSEHYYARLLSKIEVCNKHIDFINEYIRHIKDENNNTF